MPTAIFPVRLSRQERQKFAQAARAEGKTLSEWLREAGRARAAQSKRRAAIFTFTDRVELDPEAERNPKAFIRAKLNGLHR